MSEIKIALLTKLGTREPAFKFFKALQSLNYQPHVFQQFKDIDNPNQYSAVIHFDNAEYQIYKKQGNVPNAYISIDTTIVPNRCALQSKELDCVFFAQRKARASFRQEKIHWLPNGFDHFVAPLNNDNYDRMIDVSAIGDFIRRADRRVLYDLLTSKLDKNIKLFISNKVDYTEISTIYNLSKLVVNPTLGDINFRTFESMGQGALCITHDNEENGSRELGLENYKNCVFYKNDEEVIDIINSLLHNDLLRTSIASEGIQLMYNKHTYVHRVLEMISVINGWFNTQIPLHT